MKVCFYWFNLSTPPGMSIGVSILAHELADAGHDVDVVLLNERVGMPFEPGLLEEHARKNDFDLHALSFGQNHYPPAMQLASILKRAAPRSRVLCGGVHTTLNAEEVLGHPDVDYVGIGEVDGLLTRFVAALESGCGYDSVPNFWVKEGARITRNPIAGLPDITDQTSLFLEGIDYGPLIQAARGFAETVVGRGCPMKCNYCHNAAIQDTYRRLGPDPAPKLRFCRLRAVANVIDELKAFKEKYPEAIRAFNFGDDVFASDREWLRDFSARYAKEIGLPFISNAIAGQIDEETAQLLADAGCNMVKFGVESGSERIRREVLNRQLSQPKLADSVRRLHAKGINTRAYVMLGMPTETPDEMHSTLKLCAELRFDSVRPAIMYPFPGTEIHRFCVDHDLIDESRIPTDYSTTTVLRLPEPERIRIEKTAALYPWLLNTFLGGETAAAAQPLIDRVLSTSGPDWRKLLSERGATIHESLNRSGAEHYHAPFPDRQDVIFLYRQRARPLINVEGGGQP
jgi:anaerobic magnesium-protoporphyrin IX monomethyl ester cyclase